MKQDSYTKANESGEEAQKETTRLTGCLHDTGATFAPERVHPGSLSWLYIC